MITYQTGDAALDPVDGVIAHVCNNVAAWGAGFTHSLNKRDAGLANAFTAGGPTSLGLVQFLELNRDPELYLANMVAQNGLFKPSHPRPLDYAALAHCLAVVGDFAREGSHTIHMPRIGTGLAGGNWKVIEPLINANMGDLNVVVYTLPEGT